MSLRNAQERIEFLKDVLSHGSPNRWTYAWDTYERFRRELTELQKRAALAAKVGR